MAISLKEAQDMAHRYHMAISSGASVKEVADFFTHPDGVAVYVPHGEDLTIQAVLDIIKGYTNQQFVPMDPWTLTVLSEKPEKVRVTGAIHWSGRPVESPDEEMGSVCGEDWIVERCEDGKLRFSLYINPYHHEVPGTTSSGLK